MWIRKASRKSEKSANFLETPGYPELTANAPSFTVFLQQPGQCRVISRFNNSDTVVVTAVYGVRSVQASHVVLFDGINPGMTCLHANFSLLVEHQLLERLHRFGEPCYLLQAGQLRKWGTGQRGEGSVGNFQFRTRAPVSLAAPPRPRRVVKKATPISPVR